MSICGRSRETGSQKKHFDSKAANNQTGKKQLFFPAEQPTNNEQP